MLFMKSRVSNINKLNWESSTLSLAKTKSPTKSLQKIHGSGFKSLKDLLWIFPLRVQSAPKLLPFSHIHIDELFLGEAKLINLNLSPAYGRSGKGKVQLFNATIQVQDTQSSAHLTLKFFNIYPGFKKQMEEKEIFTFMGTPTEYKGILQIVNPKINPPAISTQGSGVLIEYPTVNTVPGKEVQKLIDNIPSELWDTEIHDEISELKEKLALSPLISSFKIMHGKSTGNKEQAKERIIIEEFLQGQLMLLARKLKNKKLVAPVIKTTPSSLTKYLDIFPYELTHDQVDVLRDIQNDFMSGYPMMRMIQGDVGSGKTSVAIISALIAIENNGQVALMCPTETLATQHYKTITEILCDNFSIDLILGSTKAADKKEINARLKNGKTQLIIGTHSLIQKSIHFKQLTLAIIDEQHKFGVEQRQVLFKKGDGVHTIIMSATPIPRTLQLAQYGDLDISTIRTMPLGRKGVKTRIIRKDTYEKYLSFIKTRITLGEQVYVVAPAIEESETLNLKNVQEIENQYKKYFPDLSIGVLHGKLSSVDKAKVMEDFTNKKIDILISTTVIEVGINIINSTVISIYNPDRFGLSSLHQLRGRVGRGDKTGFCFLIANQNISKDSLDRIKIIEKTIDGFEIAEADLKNRGAGNLFGASQSGHISSYRLANIFEHFTLFEKVGKDIEQLRHSYPEKLNNVLLTLTEETKITATI